MDGKHQRPDAPAVYVPPPRLVPIVLKRTLASWPLAVGAFAAVLLAATLLAAAPMYAGAAANAGLVAKLREAPVTEAGLEVTDRVDATEYRRVDAKVRRELQASFGAAVEPARSGESGSLAAAGGRRYALAFFAGIEREASLVAGRWPRSGGPLEAVLSSAAARVTGLGVGDVARLRERDGSPLDVRVVGEYAPVDRDAALWWGDSLALRGVRGTSLRTFGPLVLDEREFLRRPQSFRAAWRARPEAASLDIGRLAATAARIETLADRIGGGSQTRSPAVVITGLDRLLEEAREQVVVARAGVLVPLLQLALLAGYGLVFVAGLLRGRRAREDELLRTRGAGRRLLAAAASADAAVLCAVAALAAPWVAAVALEAVDAFGPLAVAGLDLQPRVDRAAYVLAAAGALACALALALPALGRDGLGRRLPRRHPLERSGVDVALLVLVAVTLWHLRRRGSPVVLEGGGAQIDLLLVAVPALGVFAGAVLAGRLFPLLLGGISRALDRGGAPQALAGRRLARGAAEHRPAALMLVSALAIGTFAAAYASTWSQTQERRALVRAGAGVLVSPDRRSGSYPAIGLARAYARIPGVVGVSPVVRRTIDSRDGAAQLVAVDAASLAAAPGPAGPAALLRLLAHGRPDGASLPLPADVRRLEIPLTARLLPLPPDVDLQPFGIVFRLTPATLPELGIGITAVVRDADGLLHRVAGKGRAGDGPIRLELVPAAVGLRPARPLRLTALELTLNMPAFVGRRVELELGPLRGVDLGRSWSATAAPTPLLAERTRARVVVAGERLRIVLDSGATVNEAVPAVVTLRPGRPARFDPLPAIAGPGLTRSLGVGTGDLLELEVGGLRRPVRIAGTVPSFPTVPEGDRFLVLDLPTLAEATYADRQEVVEPAQWLLAIGSEQRSGEIVQALESPPLSSERVVARTAVAQALTTDPLAVATSGALWLGFGAAAVFALAVAALAATARLRAHALEVAALRALGLDRRGTRAMLLLEGSVVVCLSAAAGVALGVGLAYVVLPAVAMTETGAASVPAPLVEIPWATIGVLALALVVALTFVNLVQARRAVRLPLAGTLRDEVAR